MILFFCDRACILSGFLLFFFGVFCYIIARVRPTAGAPTLHLPANRLGDGGVVAWASFIVRFSPSVSMSFCSNSKVPQNFPGSCAKSQPLSDWVSTIFFARAYKEAPSRSRDPPRCHPPPAAVAGPVRHSIVSPHNNYAF